MLIFSGLVILFGLAGLYLQGGLNLGIDFKGGLTEQVQILPSAFAIGRTGDAAVTMSISSDGFLNLSIQAPGQEEAETSRYDFKDYSTIGNLTGMLSEIEYIQIDSVNQPDAETSRIYQKEEVSLSDQAVVVNMFLASGEEIFASIDVVREALSELERYTIQTVGSPMNQEYIIRIEAPADDKEFQQRIEEKVRILLADAFGGETIIFKKSDFVGPQFSRNLTEQTLSLIAVALTLILIYISFRFRFFFAVGAILALVHDVAIMLGVIGTFQLEVTTATTAAILTIIGYSLNDTIVIFDRIRENESLMRDSSFKSIINTSISQSLSRTLITSITTLLAVVAIYIFATGEIKTFALNMIIGVVVGTYSSIFVASPVLLLWRSVLDRRRKSSQASDHTASSKPPEKPEKAVDQNDTSADKDSPARVPPKSMRIDRQKTGKSRASRKKRKK